MKLIVASTLALFLSASVWAQRGGSSGHGGMTHLSSGFSSGRSFPPPAASRASGNIGAYRPNFAYPRSYQSTSAIGPPPFGATFPPGSTYPTGANRGFHGSYPNGRYRPYYYSRGVYLVPGWAGYYDYGYPSDYSSQQSPAPDANAYAQEPPSAGDEQAYEQLAPRPPYQPEQSSSPDIQEQPPTMLLFKDRRAPQQVKNYAVTRTTLYVLDGERRREIPLDQLDLPLTERTNRDAGVDFAVPAGAE